MYVATRDLKTVHGPVRAGDPVLGTEKWAPHILNATISAGFIKLVPDQEKKGKKQAKDYSPPQHATERCTTVPDVETGVAVNSPEIACTKCSRTGFKSVRALKVHLSRHK